MAAAVFLSSDLMFSSRVLGAAKTIEVSVDLVPNAAALAERITADCRLVLVDLALGGLDLPAAVCAVRAKAEQAQIVAFGAHVDVAALDAARAAGCDEVLTRGQFNKQYVELLKTAAR